MSKHGNGLSTEAGAGAGEEAAPRPPGGARTDGVPAAIVAVDTGGTFTDVVCLRGGEVTVLKVPSTPDDPARAVLEGVRRALGLPGSTAEETDINRKGAEDAKGTAQELHLASEAAQLPRRRSDGVPTPTPLSAPSAPLRLINSAVASDEAGGGFLLIHGSTVATNALLERRGARVGLVTNRGFEDILAIGRQNRPQLYALEGERPPPLVESADRHGVAGRVGPGGIEEAPIEETELEELAARLEGVESVAVCLLHSYANPVHERRVADALARLGVPVSVSAELLPEYREYERTATTVVNAYVAPRMDRYLGRLERESGAERVRIMGSGGGAVPVARARREAVHTILSGPAGGAIGALDVARQAGAERIITFDMGGTSTDVSLCPGRPLHTREFSIAGVPVAIPVLDIHTVGAGGGSLAWVDAGGALRVGPRSAGAQPGPICYGRGGTQVTVTDAHVWLGRLPPDAFLGGEQRLDRAAIEGPLRALADRLGMTPETAAEGVLAVADTAMEGALRVISVERGYDPADFALVPFGGAAGLHAVELAERLGVPSLVLPPDPGVLSAYGMLISPVRKDAARTVLLAADADAPARLEAVFAELEAQAAAAMAEEGIAAAALTLERRVDARYRGQSHELRVPADAWVEAFHHAHESRYGFARRDATVEAVTLRLEATAPVLHPPPRTLPAAEAAAAPVAGRGDVVYRGERIEALRHERSRLRPGHRLAGPAVVVEYSATTWLPPGWRAEVHESGSLRIERG